METLLQGLILAAISGITFVAYKHPKAFRKIDKFLSPLVLVVFFVFFIFMMGYGIGFADAKMNEEKLEYKFWHYLIFSVTFIYLGLLKSFPLIFENEEDDHPESPESKKLQENGQNQSSETID